jgi:hypothetical protein
VYYYDYEYRRQYCQERFAQARDEYRRVQAPPKDSSERRNRAPVAWVRSVWDQVRRQAAQRAPVYRS